MTNLTGTMDGEDEEVLLVGVYPHHRPHLTRLHSKTNGMKEYNIHGADYYDIDHHPSNSSPRNNHEAVSEEDIVDWPCSNKQEKVEDFKARGTAPDTQGTIQRTSRVVSPTNNHHHHHRGYEQDDGGQKKPDYEERLGEAERQLKILESNIVLHKRLAAMEETLQQREQEIRTLQSQVQDLLALHHKQDHQLRKIQQQQQQQHQEDSPQGSNSNAQWDSSVVTWKIPSFEKELTYERHFFESSIFSVGSSASFYLTVCVLEVGYTVPESERPIAIFIKSAAHKLAKQRHNHQATNHKSVSLSSIFPLRLDGTSITLVANKKAVAAGLRDKTVQVGETRMEDQSQGKGVRQFTTLGKLRDLYLQKDDSVIVRATVRVPHVHTYQLETI